MALIGLWASAPGARAATGELAAFGSVAYPPTADQFWSPGPVALDSSDDNSLFIADFDPDRNSHLRKFSKGGTPLASLVLSLTDSLAQPMYVIGLAVDPELDRLYALVDADADGPQTAQEILVYSTTPSCPTPATCTLVAPSAPAALADGVLIDFGEETDSAVDFATGLAVDPETNDVVVLGVDDAAAADPNGVLQYVSSDGEPSQRVTGLGAGLDPDGAAVLKPAGLDIAPNGDVYILTASGYTLPFSSASVYRIPRGGTASLVLVDANEPLAVPGALDFGVHLPTGSPIAVSGDGETLYLAEGNSATGRVRGFSTATGALKISYGGGTGSCQLLSQGGNIGLSAGDGLDVAAVIWDLGGGAADPPPTVHLFGTGGTGCPRAEGAFSVNGATSGAVTVTKGQTVTFDGSASQLLGGTPSSVDWDFDNSEAFATHPEGTPPPLTITKKFLATGTYHVGLRIAIDGAPPTEPVFRDVTVIASTPTASFKVSNNNPAAGATVTFDAGNSVDPTGSASAGPTNDLAKYRWDFGDGSQQQETTAKTITHAFANAGTAALARTVKLTVVSHDDMASNPVQQTVTVAGTPAPPPPGNNTTTTTPTPTDPVKPPPAVAPPKPTVSGSSVDSKGMLGLKVACPAGGIVCTGKVELTIKVKKKVKGKTKTVTLRLGTVTFTIDQGKSKDIRLKLSAAGRSLLKKQKKLRASAAISVTAAGKTSTTSKPLTLKAPAKKKSP